MVPERVGGRREEQLGNFSAKSQISLSTFYAVSRASESLSLSVNYCYRRGLRGGIAKCVELLFNSMTNWENEGLKERKMRRERESMEAEEELRRSMKESRVWYISGSRYYLDARAFCSWQSFS